MNITKTNIEGFEKIYSELISVKIHILKKAAIHFKVDEEKLLNEYLPNWKVYKNYKCEGIVIEELQSKRDILS